jgi:hypothetical protein
VKNGANEIPLGEGRIDIKASAWTGTASAPSAIPWNWAVAPSYLNTSTHGPYLFSDGFAYTTNGAGRLVITSLVETGIPIKTAFDAVFGGGAYAELAADTWEALQAA